MSFRTSTRSTVASVAMVTTLAAAPLAAQDTSTSTSNSASGSGESQAQPSASDLMTPDQRVASVGGKDITGADVTEFIESLPTRMREQPPQMLISMAVQQIVLRELLLQEAEAQNLGEDPEVTSLIEEKADVAREDAMVQVYLQREIDARVTDEAVQEAYDKVAEQSEQELPPLEDVRLQIEQQLQQQAVRGIQQDLSADVEIMFYGPDGEPMVAGSDEESSESQ